MTGAEQLCTGQIAGVETAIHTVHNSFEHEDTEAVLLIDASNATAVYLIEITF